MSNNDINERERADEIGKILNDENQQMPDERIAEIIDELCLFKDAKLIRETIDSVDSQSRVGTAIINVIKADTAAGCPRFTSLIDRLIEAAK